MPRQAFCCQCGGVVWVMPCSVSCCCPAAARLQVQADKIQQHQRTFRLEETR